MKRHGNNELAVKNFTTIAKAKDVSRMTPKKRYQQLFTMSEHLVRWRQDGTGYGIATAKPGDSLRPL
jgi:hypothetical protein